MSGAPPAINDEDLMAFVDGELSAEQRRAVESYIASSPAAAERVEIWRQQGKALRAAFARVEAEPPAPVLVPYRKRTLPRLIRSCGSSPSGTPASAARSALADDGNEPIRRDESARRAARRRKLALVAAFAAGAGAALALVYFSDHLPGRQAGSIWRGPPATAADDAMAQRARDALSGFNGKTARSGSASAAAGSALIVPNLSDAGYALIGARAGQGASGDPGEEPFCLFYAKGSAQPVALCIAGKDDGAAGGAAQMSLSSEAGAAGAVASWRQAGGARYALAGSLPEGALRDLAGRVSKEVAAFDAR
ncbi:putative transmembrane anti-sigma factor [Methylocella silvestris BL2]|uniref:Putative transmembrane anti-sigma factor n=1 Tax=Methylocella silvestris (strain DSM 15510 / CIP 108128 / LMG 27833 / NCIMB 13906 / BL2) TaxID=395965 RepID=B8EK27_METSB|nr:hypothetical protein [Methylocella silvestris]ACK49974.1 putative transmembrane anti-sigma factor [Methylocella silvestris BL2]